MNPKPTTNLADNNPYERAGRLEKAVKLADALTRLGVDDPEIVKELSENSWVRLARAAHCKPPSEATISVVLTMLEDRQATPDAFVGLEAGDSPRALR